MIKVLTPQQLKEHNKLLEQQLLLDKENEKEEENEDYQERLDDWAERIASIWDTMASIEEQLKQSATNGDINQLKEEINGVSLRLSETNKQLSKELSNKSNIKHTHTMAWIEWLIDELDSLQSQLDNTTQTINNELKTKLGDDYKPKVEDITWLKEELNKLYEKIQSIKIPEVDLSDYYTKDKVYNKDETYNKKEVDSKIVRLWSSKSWAWYNYINDSITDDYFTRSSTNIADQIATAVWPYVTVWRTWSGATYICDWVADQVQINQALATLKNVYILKWTYNLTWSILINSSQRIIWAWVNQTIITWDIITSSARVTHVWVELLTCKSIEINWHYVTIDRCRVINTSSYWIKFIPSSSSSCRIRNCRMSGSTAGLYMGKDANDCFITNVEVYWWQYWIYCEWWSSLFNWVFSWDISIASIYQNKANLFDNIRCGDTPIVMLIDWSANNTIWIIDGVYISNLTVIWDCTDHVIKIISWATFTAKVVIKSGKWVSDNETIEFVWPWNIKCYIHRDGSIADVLQTWTPIIHSENYIKQADIITATVASAVKWMIYLDDWTNTWTWTPWYMRYNWTIRQLL